MEIGFSIPMLLVGYSTHYFRGKFKSIREHPYVIRIISGLVLVVFGAYTFLNGIINFGF